MNIYAITALVNVATSIVLGLLVVLADRRSPVNRSFGAFAASVALWSYAYFSWQIATDHDTALLWTHLLMAGAILIPPIYFHFSTYFLGIHKEQRTIIISGYIFVVIFSVLNWSSLYIRDVISIAGFQFWPIAGPAFAPFLVFWIFFALYPIFLFLRALRQDESKRAALRFILFGTIIGYGGGITNYFLWYGIPVLPFGNISASIYLSFVAYAIMRLRLFNMKVIATELLIFMLWLFAFVRLLLAVSSQDQLVDGLFLAVLLIVGVMLIRSVDREVEQREKIEKLSEEKSEFMTFASHEIRNPITAMRGYASLIADGTTGEVNAKTKEAANTILIQGSDVLNLIAQYLSKSKMELGQISYAKQPFDMAAIVNSIAAGYRPHAEQKGLTLTTKIDPSQQYVVVGDEGKVKEVIGNIVDNSLKYTKTGGITISVERHGISIRAVVSDTGVGIPAETLPQLFKKFSRADAQKVNLLGTGIGLYLAKTFIEAQGAHIWAESDGKDKGSRFIIEFPAV